MESNLKLSVTSTEAFNNIIGCPVVNNEKLDKSAESTADGESHVSKGCDNKSENGLNLQQCIKSESVVQKEKDRVIKRFNYNDSPPTKLIGDDGTTITVKDVTATKSISVSGPSKVNMSKDNDNDSGIGSLTAERNKSWLLRLFESKLFDSSMAISYMFNSKEPGKT